MASLPRALQWHSKAIKFDIVPDGTNKAASFPSSLAAVASNSIHNEALVASLYYIVVIILLPLMVGSSLYTSSPTTADAIAVRISESGFVTVSLLKSIMLT